jgi:putative mycofactocin binding protein MftB
VRGLLSPPESDRGRVAGWDPSDAYEVDPDVALRPEPFGALAYHYGSRRLTFLRSPLLAQLVRELGDYDSIDAALSATVPPAEWPAFRRALGSLAQSHFIRARAAASSGPASA